MERYFDLYLNAGVSVPLVINANQYDKSETWLFTLYGETGIQFRPASGSIVGLKADGNTIVNAGTVNSSGQVVIQETEQITAVAGKNEYELILDGTHGTANFVVLVERRPGDNAVPSESDISLISQAVQAASGIEAVLVLQNTVASLQEEVNQWVAEHAGTTNETTLWEGDLDTDTPITLSHPATQYDVIAVYTNIANSDNSAVTPEAHYYRADEFKQGSVFISCGRTDVETGASTEIIAETVRLITNTTGTTTTVSLDTRKEVRWNGQASSNAGITFPTMPSVVRITGIKTVQDDQEIVNARVGKDGTRYNTLKARLDAEEVIVDSSLTVSGAAADAKKTGDEISDLKSQIGNLSNLETETKTDLVSAINEAAQTGGSSGDGLTSAIKAALLQLAQKVAYIDEEGQTYYDDLYDALYAITAIRLNKNSLSFNALNGTQQLTATTTPEGGTVTWTSSNTSVATVSSTGLVTAVGFGNATITATSGSKSATCAVTIAQATVTSISANYTQSGTVLDSASLDDLKSDLVVTANWSNGNTETVSSSDYTLSGTLSAGTSAITVSYAGKNATFNVTVTEDTREYIYYDYLKGDGTAFIDTNLSAKTYGADSYKKYFRFAYTDFGTSSSDAIFGARNKFSYTGYYIMGSAAPKIRVCLCGTHTDIPIQLGTVHEVLIDNKHVYFDGTDSYSGTNATTTITSTTMTMPLFANVTGDNPSDPSYTMAGGGKALGFSKVKLYEFKLSDANDNVIADMIPARRKSDNAVGMYDTVRETFFENARDTGEFTIGND